ncbi:LysM peptidoglycan-binding domain-containing M23 family metallopeptidase [Roseibium sp. TrichSKD4]|uniref:LysM peptidoglycan-binding domain-containing M23 family metallopeptidase n=1 Tax=Roseibium sp. TrichSKD4 TaxID=744980 RepID=UPI0002EF368B|nr:LysM peptidoglycan-binding domain-containing M23 family metallopeptidase [Roseibium sp. TrichSKD4]
MTKRKRILRSDLMCKVALVSLVAGMAAGCSDAVERLGGGPVYTGGTANQREILTGSAKQPTYEDIMYGSGGTVAGLPAANSAPVTTGSIPTTSYKPPVISGPVQPSYQPVRPTYQQPQPVAQVQTRPLAHMPQAPTAPVYASRVPVPTPSPLGGRAPVYAQQQPTFTPTFQQPTYNQPLPSASAPVYTGFIPTSPNVPAAVTSNPTVSNPVTWKGWTSAGGTRVPVRTGDTLHSMSRRFGVPVNAVAAVNGISDPSQVRAGQTLIIPTYVYSSRNGTTDATVSSTSPVRLPAPTNANQQFSTGSIPNQIVANATVPGRKPGGYQPTFEQIARGRLPTATIPAQQIAPPTTVASITQPYATSSVAPRRKPFAHGGSQGMSIASISSQQSDDNLTTASISGMSRAPAIPAAVVPVPRRQPVRKISTASSTAPAVPTRTPVPNSIPARNAEAKPTKPIGRPQIATAEPQATEPAGPMFRWPVRGRIISEFGPTAGGGRNEGVNLAVPAGTPVKAAADGTVIYAGNELKGYGNLVLVRHDDGWVSAYAHNSKLQVKRGETIRRGDVVANAGATGSVSQPQVHFELRRGNKPVNPMRYLPRT